MAAAQAAPAAAAAPSSPAPAAAAQPATTTSADKEKAAAAAATNMQPATDKSEGGKPLVDFNIHVKAPPIGPEMAAKLKQLREELAKEKVYAANAAMRYYCDEPMLHRYLRARGGNVAKAKEMLLASLEWRKEMRPELIRAPDMALEGRTGKVVVCHHKDRHGRPIMCMDGSKENTKNAVDQLRFVAWNLHRCWMKMQDGVEKYVLFINLTNYSFFNSPPIRTTLETVKTLVSRYPEHMGHCIMYQAPRLFSALWAMATPIIDAHMLSKVLFVQGDTSAGSKNDKILREIVGDNWKQMLYVEGKEFEKTCPIGFDHSAFWPVALEDDKLHGARYAELEAQWAKEDGGRAIRNSSNVGIPPADLAAREKEREEAAKKAEAAAAKEGKSTPASPPSAGASPTPASPAVVVTPASGTAASASASKAGAAGASPSKPVPIDTSKATLEVSPLPAPPQPNTPIVIPPEALGATPASQVRVLPAAAAGAGAGTVTPPSSQSGK